MSPVTIAAVEPGLRRLAIPPSAPTTVRLRAAVAIVLREHRGEAEVLVVRRAEREGDRWSGDAALPGGRVDPEDASIVATAIRETREEVGLDLLALGARHLGRLLDQPGPAMQRWSSLAITPVVFAVEGDPKLSLDPREVASAKWIPLRALRSQVHRSRTFYWMKPLRRVPVGVPMFMPCWRYQDLVIWGLTHDILKDLLSLIPR